MAFGSGTIGAFGGAVSDLFQSQATAKGLRLKGQGNRVEADNYDIAADLAEKNLQFTQQSTQIKEAMADRQIYMGMGTTEAGIAGAGFQNTGSALDLMRSGAAQGALQKQVMSQQGLITEEGYKTQIQSYGKLAEYARYAAGVQDEMADDAITAGKWSAGFKAASGIASLFL